MSEEKKNEVLNQAQALDDKELGDVAGGKGCFCALGGGGTADQAGEKTCACVAAGAGEWNSEGAAIAEKKTRCYCALGGDGASRKDLDEQGKDYCYGYSG